MQTNTLSPASIKPPSLRIKESLARTHRLCALFAIYAVCAFSLCQIVGWALALDWIKHPFPNEPALPSAAAIMFFLCCCSWLLVARDNENKRLKLLGQTLAIFVAITSGATFIEHTFNLDWSLSYPLYQRDEGSTPLTFPGPILPDMSLYFGFLGIGLFLLGFNKTSTYKWAQIMAILSGLPNFLTFLCFFCGMWRLCAVFGCIKFSPIASLTFAVISYSLYFAKPEQDITNILLRDTKGGELARRLCVGALLIMTLLLGPVRLWLIRLGVSTQLFDDAITNAIILFLGILLIAAFVAWSFNKYDEKTEADANEKRVRAIIEGVPVGLMSLTTDGRIEFFNQNATAMFNVDAPDAIGKHISRFFALGNNQNSEEFWAQLRNKSPGQISELTAQKFSGGALFPVECSVVDFEMEDGPRCLASVLDITSRYEIQQLRQAFVAVVSHELRTPLASIGGFLHLLNIGAYGGVDDKIKNEAGRANRSVGRLMSLINGLLDLESLESGGVIIARAPCDLSIILEQSLDSVEVFAKERSVNLVMPKTCREGTVELYADPDRIVQVLVNLISNAVKFSQKDGTVEVYYESQDGLLKISVKDYGRGVPIRYRESIFERFQQVEVADTKSKGGTGLGLAICKAIVERHGGNIGVDSEEGEGSTFWFTLPLEEDD